MPPLEIPTNNHNDGEKSKRFGHRAPTFPTWLEFYLTDGMCDCAVAILLNLTPNEVQELKSCIRHHLRSRTVTIPLADIYYPKFGPPAARKRLCQKGGLQLGWHLSPSKTSALVRSPVAFAVSLEFPHLFKEPASLEEYRREWIPNADKCFNIVPHHFRRDILARLIEICADEMKQNKDLRTAATDFRPYTPKPASHSNTNNPSVNKRPRTDPPQTDLANSLKRDHGSLEYFMVIPNSV
ncbi:hypothetical protein KCU95_g1942, partial [Aureobasidium melanogenum]